MSEVKTPKEVIRELLVLTPGERAKRVPKDGFEQVAKTYLDEAIESRDGGMLKYVIEMVEEAADDKSKSGSTLTPAERVEALANQIKRSIDG